MTHVDAERPAAAHEQPPHRRIVDLLAIDQTGAGTFEAGPRSQVREHSFGGAIAAQALFAASRTVSAGRLPHSVHCHFLRPGNTTAATTLHVDRIRDGRSYATRAIAAEQGGKTTFTMTAAFHEPEPGWHHQTTTLEVPDPVWNTSTGNCASWRPSATSSACDSPRASRTAATGSRPRERSASSARVCNELLTNSWPTVSGFASLPAISETQVYAALRSTLAHLPPVLLSLPDLAPLDVRGKSIPAAEVVRSTGAAAVGSAVKSGQMMPLKMCWRRAARVRRSSSPGSASSVERAAAARHRALGWGEAARHPR